MTTRRQRGRPAQPYGPQGVDRKALSPAPDAVFTADLHLTDRQPPCRTDDYWAAQASKLEWLRDLCDDWRCPLVVAGDVFDEASPSYRVYCLAAEWLAGFHVDVLLVAGQHDLPYHRADAARSALAALRWTRLQGERHALAVILDKTRETDRTLPGATLVAAPFGAELPGGDVRRNGMSLVGVTHRMVSDGPADLVLGVHAHATPAVRYLRERPHYDLIVTGDNHRPFCAEEDGRLLVNCGSLLRRRADQAAHRPVVWAWWREGNEVVPVAVPHEPDTVSREHVDAPAARDERLAAFVARLDGAADTDLGDDFVQTVIELATRLPEEWRDKLRTYLRAIVKGEEPDYGDDKTT